MNNNLKTIIRILILIWLLPYIVGFIITIARAFGFSTSDEFSTGFNDYARITDIEYKAEVMDEVNNGGNVLITERLTFDVHAASEDNLYWELWRELPESYIDGLHVHYKVNSVKQILADGTEIIYEESPKLYWYDEDYVSSIYGPNKWYHSEGPYSEYNRQYECVLFYVNGLYREEVTFEIEYIMYNATFKYSDVSELYLSMYSGDTIKYLDSFKGEILIPNKDMPKQGNYKAHTYGTNNSTFKITESSTKNPGYYTFSFDLDKNDLKFKNYNRYLEFSLLSYNEDKYAFSDYAPNNVYTNTTYLDEAITAMNEYDDAYETSRRQITLSTIIIVVGAIMLLIFVTNRDKKIKTKYIITTPEEKILYNRDIPSKLDPYFAAALVFAKTRHKVDMGDIYSALLLSLVRKKYLELTKVDQAKDWTPSNTQIVMLYYPEKEAPNLDNTSLDAAIKNKDIFDTKLVTSKRVNKNGVVLENLTINEEAYFNLIAKHNINGHMTMAEFQDKISRDYNNTNTFVTAMDNSVKEIGVSQGYFSDTNFDRLKNSTNSLGNTYIIIAIIVLLLGYVIQYNAQVGFSLLGIIILSVAFLICGILLKIFSKDYNLFTQFGKEEYTKWYALYNFLNSATLINEKSIVELPLWEEYLVYATAFGISEKVIKALEIRCPDLSPSPILSNSLYRSRTFISYNRSIRKTTYRTIRTYHNYSSGGFSSFGSRGFGGSGRGGGGGGGGH